MGDLFYYNIFIGYNRLLGIVHKLISRRIKDAMFMSFLSAVLTSIGYRSNVWVMSHLFVYFVTLVIQGGAMAKFWPLHHIVNQYMGENRRKTLSTARGRGVCQADIFTKYRLGCELSYGTCPISLCAL